MSTIKYWVWLSTLHSVTPRMRNSLLEHFAGIDELYFSTREELKRVEGIDSKTIDTVMQKDTTAANKIIDECEHLRVGIITLQDAQYPRRLMQIFDPPAVLYVKGKLPAIDEEPAIAIVGTRKASPYGIKMAQRIGYEITKCGGLVVTGLAAGVDSAGALGALRAGGRCIGVLGTGIDVVYPSFNRSLFDDVTAAGAILSEYPPGAPVDKRFFPQRNRIIAGLSVGVTIIEAPRKSGSLITAGQALEQGRDVFVVPGNADAPNCVGSNELIRDGAKAVTTGWDIIGEYEGLYPYKISKVTGEAAKIPQESEPIAEKPEKKVLGVSRETGEGFYKLRVPTEKKIIDKQNAKEYIDLEGQFSKLTQQQLKIVTVMEKPSMHVDDIIDLSKLPAATVLSELTVLQIQGYVCQERGKRFSLNIAKG